MARAGLRLMRAARPAALVATLTLLLSLRAVGATLMLLPGGAAGDGHVPICSGAGTVLWISLDTLEPVAEADLPAETAADPCPWFGLAAAVEAPLPPEAPAPTVRAAAPPPHAPRAPPAAAPASAYRSRAPPAAA
ncbi:MAG: hypothetical protein VYD87_05550 [Pseudomonadota bacterium]|nr:hypothetical protein [Pseudomonadota bacterium]